MSEYPNSRGPMKRSRLNTKVSCTTCRRRKQRCELPEDEEGEVVYGPREGDAACRRCRLLGFACEVQPADADASQSSKRKSPVAGPSHTSSPAPRPPSHASSRGRSEFLVTFNTPDETSSKSSQDVSHRDPSTIYHGRPLHLAEAMLGERLFRPTGFNPDMYRQMQLFAPFIPAYPSDQTLAGNLLRMISVWLSKKSPGKCPNLDGLIADVVMEAHSSLDTVQTLLLLNRLAPFGILPYSETRGLVIQEGFRRLAHGLFNLPASASWMDETLWTWIELRIVEAESSLEKPDPKPSLSMDFHRAVGTVKGLLEVPMMGDNLAPAKFALCDRIQRLAIVHETMIAFNFEVQQACEFLPAPHTVETIRQIQKTSIERLDAVADRTDGLLTLYPPTGKAFIGNLQVHRLYELGLVRQRAMRTLISLAFIPGGRYVDEHLAEYTPLNVLDPFASVEDRQTFANSCACNPLHIIRFFRMKSKGELTDLAEEAAGARGAVIEDLLCALNDMVPESGIDRRIPLTIHRIAALTVDSASVIFEHQALGIIFGSSAKITRSLFRISQRLLLMRQAAISLRALEPGSETVSDRIATLVEDMCTVGKKRIEAMDKMRSNPPGSSSSGAGVEPPQIPWLTVPDGNGFDFVEQDAAINKWMMEIFSTDGGESSTEPHPTPNLETGSTSAPVSRPDTALGP